MTVMKRKQLKAFVKPVRRLIKKHGPEMAIEQVTNLITYLAADNGHKTVKGLQKQLKKGPKAEGSAAASPVDKGVAQDTGPAKAPKKKHQKPAEVAVAEGS